MTYSKPVGLWAVPRSVSTALERVIVERGDFKVFHEPFSASYYYSPERRSDRFAAIEAKEEYGYEKVLERMLEIEEKRVYFKDMAYHVVGFMSREFVSRFTNTFIIREPAPVIASLNRFWPDFTLEETGYEEQYRLFGLAVENGEDPAVVDAADLTADPEGTIRVYCEKLGVEFMPEALSWEPGEVAGWEMWTEWHEEAQESTGIKSQPLEDDMEAPAGLESVYEHCLPYYEELHEKRLKAHQLSFRQPEGIRESGRLRPRPRGMLLYGRAQALRGPEPLPGSGVPGSLPLPNAAPDSGGGSGSQGGCGPDPEARP